MQSVINASAKLTLQGSRRRVFLGSSFHRFGFEKVSSRAQGCAQCKLAPPRVAEGELPTPSPAGATPGPAPRAGGARRGGRNKAGSNLRPQGVMDVRCQLPFPPLLLHPFLSIQRSGRETGPLCREREQTGLVTRSPAAVSAGPPRGIGRASPGRPRAPLSALRTA